MDLYRVLAELARERDLIDEAIAHLERLAPGAHGVSNRSGGRVQEQKPQEKVRAAGGAFD